MQMEIAYDKYTWQHYKSIRATAQKKQQQLQLNYQYGIRGHFHVAESRRAQERKKMAYSMLDVVTKIRGERMGDKDEVKGTKGRSFANEKKQQHTTCPIAVNYR